MDTNTDIAKNYDYDPGKKLTSVYYKYLTDWKHPSGKFSIFIPPEHRGHENCEECGSSDLVVNIYMKRVKEAAARGWMIVEGFSILSSPVDANFLYFTKLVKTQFKSTRLFVMDHFTQMHPAIELAYEETLTLDDEAE